MQVSELRYRGLVVFVSSSVAMTFLGMCFVDRKRVLGGVFVAQVADVTSAGMGNSILTAQEFLVISAGNLEADMNRLFWM